MAHLYIKENDKMEFISFTATGEKVYALQGQKAPKSFLRRSALVQLIGMIAIPGALDPDGLVRFTKKLEDFDGFPTTLPNYTGSKPFKARRRQGEGVFPFLLFEGKTNEASVILMPHRREPNVYLVKLAVYGPLYPIDPENKFWETHSFNARVIPVAVDQPTTV